MIGSSKPGILRNKILTEIKIPNNVNTAISGSIIIGVA